MGLEQKRLEAVFFDMDDTLLEPLSYNPWLRFKQLHCLPPELLILDGIALRPESEQARLHRELIAYENRLAEASCLRQGMREVLAHLEALALPTALLTNNHRKATQTVLQKHNLEFSLVLTRDEAQPKPSPDLLEKALLHFGLSPTQVAYVGDSMGDLEACKQLGVAVYFLATPHNPEFSPRFEYPSELLDALLTLR